MKCVSCGRFGHQAGTCATVPAARHGQDNGGIRTVADIMDRCVIDEETDCWRWAGAVASNTTKSICPVAWFPAEERVASVLRIAYGLTRPTATMAGRMVWRTCRSNDCCNPKHLRLGTRKEWGQWITKDGHRKGDPLASSRNRKARIDSGDAILSMELARWIRESAQTGKQIAHALGVSETSISRARLGKTWGATVRGASVFSLGGGQ